MQLLQWPWNIWNHGESPNQGASVTHTPGRPWELGGPVLLQLLHATGVGRVGINWDVLLNHTAIVLLTKGFLHGEAFIKRHPLTRWTSRRICGRRGIKTVWVSLQPCHLFLAMEILSLHNRIPIGAVLKKCSSWIWFSSLGLSILVTR